MKYAVNEDEKGLIWGKWKINDGLWVLTNRWFNFCYLILGREKAILFDTGCGEGNIREVAESITDLPVLVVLSHGHWDHSAGIVWWNSCYCMEGSAEDFYCETPTEIAELFENRLVKDFQWKTVREGTIFDLGGRELEVLSSNAHAKSGMFLLDRTEHLLFSGDEIDPGQVLLTCRDELTTDEELQLMLADMEKLTRRSNEFSVIFSAHNGIALSKDYLADYTALTKQLIAGTAAIKDSVAGFCWSADEGQQGPHPSRRAEYGLASLVTR